MNSEQFLKYLSIAGSICSIIALLITVTVELNVVSIISIVIAVIGSIILLAFLIWLIKRVADKVKALFDSRPALWLFYFLGTLISIVFTCSFFTVLYGIIGLLLTAFINLMKDGLATMG